MKIKPIKLIISIVLLLAILGGGGYYVYNNIDEFTQEEPIEGTETEPIATESIEEQTTDILLDEEIKKKVAALNKVLLTNYLKITDFKRKDTLGNYEAPGIEFYQFVIDYNFDQRAMADYDIKIDKGSINEEDYLGKSKLYKKQVQERMLKFFQVYKYDRLKKIGIIGYIKKLEGDNNYGLFQLGEYITDTYYDNSLDPKLLGKISLLSDYFNYEPIFFNSEPEEMLKILDSVEKELDNEDFSKLYPILRGVFFYDVKK